MRLEFLSPFEMIRKSGFYVQLTFYRVYCRACLPMLKLSGYLQNLAFDFPLKTVHVEKLLIDICEHVAFMPE